GCSRTGSRYFILICDLAHRFNRYARCVHTQLRAVQPCHAGTGEANVNIMVAAMDSLSRVDRKSGLSRCTLTPLRRRTRIVSGIVYAIYWMCLLMLAYIFAGYPLGILSLS